MASAQDSTESFCCCCCLPTLPGLACNSHTTSGQPFSRALLVALFVPVDDFWDVFEGPGLEAVEHHLLPLEVLLDGEGR